MNPPLKTSAWHHSTRTNCRGHILKWMLLCNMVSPCSIQVTTVIGDICQGLALPGCGELAIPHELKAGKTVEFACMPQRGKHNGSRDESILMLFASKAWSPSGKVSGVQCTSGALRSVCVSNWR